MKNSLDLLPISVYGVTDKHSIDHYREEGNGEFQGPAHADEGRTTGNPTDHTSPTRHPNRRPAPRRSSRRLGVGRSGTDSSALRRPPAEFRSPGRARSVDVGAARTTSRSVPGSQLIAEDVMHPVMAEHLVRAIMDDLRRQADQYRLGRSHLHPDHTSFRDSVPRSAAGPRDTRPPRRRRRRHGADRP